jgi:hypothetical protein
MQDNFIGCKHDFEKALSLLRKVVENKEFSIEERFGIYDAFLILNAAVAKIYIPNYSEEEFRQDLRMHAINIYQEFKGE